MQPLLPSVSKLHSMVEAYSILITLSFPHKDVLCKAPCNRLRECGHPCLELCYLPCRCICGEGRTPPVENAPAQRLSENSRSRSESRVRPIRTESQLASRHGSPMSQLSRRDIADQIEAFQDFAKGGHVEADQKFVEHANEQAAVTMDEETQKKLKEADDEMAAALFGEMDLIDVRHKSPPEKTDESSKKKIDGVELVRTSADGKRGVWKGTYDPLSGAGEKKGDRKEQGGGKSLLD